MTDPRLPDALERAAELLEGKESNSVSMYIRPDGRPWFYVPSNLAGWAEAVETLENEPTRAITLQRQAALDNFCDAMLGGRDG